MTLHMYILTILFSCIGMIVFFAVSVVCEWWEFAHNAFIQNMSINIACGLMVLVFTTLVQYKCEHKRAFSEYCGAVWQLVMNMLILDSCNTTAQEEKVLSIMDDLFKAYEKSDQTLKWFSSKMEKKQNQIRTSIGRLSIEYATWRLAEKERNHAAEQKELETLIQTTLTLLPNGVYKRTLEACAFPAVEIDDESVTDKTPSKTPSQTEQNDSECGEVAEERKNDDC